MKEIHLITVGKLKDKHLEAIEKQYLLRIKNPKLAIHEVKALAEDPDIEGKNVLKKAASISQNFELNLLTEFGSHFDSPKFSSWLEKKTESNLDQIFVICGAQGPSEELKNKSQSKISLSGLTFPHKLARIILIEQFYRAQTIRENHPYHN